MNPLALNPAALDRTGVHLWTASLSADDTDAECSYAILSGDERERADRIRVARARRRFIVARALLRRLLAAYLRTDPASISFGYGAHGKPCLIDDAGIDFNLAHAEDSATVAIALRRDVGVDIEAMSCDTDIDGVARLAFSFAEREALATLAPPAHRDAFCRIWSRKEAYVKARGEGFSRPMRSFSVSHLAMDDDALLADDRDVDVSANWRVTDIVAPPGFSAALAARGRDWSVMQMSVLTMARR